MDMNAILEFLNEYAVLWVAVVCGGVGWLVKHTVSAIPNQYIPLIVVVLGMFLVIWDAGWQIDGQIIVQGVCSGALAVWVHQLFKQLYEKYIEGKEQET